MGTTTFTCGDEARLSMDAGNIATFVLISSLAAFIIVGTVLDHHNRRRNHCTTADRGGFIDCYPRTAPPTGDEVAYWSRIRRTEEGMETRSPHQQQMEHKEQEEDEEQAIALEQEHVRGGDEFIAYSHGNSGGDPLLAPLISAPSPPPETPFSTTPVPRIAAEDCREDGDEEGDVTWWFECLECFSLLKNVDTLFAPPRTRNEFAALDGVRTLSMLWVVLGHVLIYSFFGPGFTNIIDIVSVDGHGLLSRWALCCVCVKVVSRTRCLVILYDRYTVIHVRCTLFVAQVFRSGSYDSFPLRALSGCIPFSYMSYPTPQNIQP